MSEGNTAPTIGEYYESYQIEKLCHSCERRDTYSSPEGQLLFCRVEGYESLFSDMLFEADSSTGKFIKVQEKVSAEWHDIDISRPDHLKGFTYRWFVFDVEDLDNGFLGKYSPLEYKLTVAPKCIDQDDVILHEMIHLHEAVLDGLSTYYRDIVLYCLYKDLRDKISDLDDRIEAHGHILNESLLSNYGGRHDILFLLKSFDLDLKMGYALGTIFGYGMADEIKNKTGSNF